MIRMTAMAAAIEKMNLFELFKQKCWWCEQVVYVHEKYNQSKLKFCIPFYLESFTNEIFSDRFDCGMKKNAYICSEFA